MAQKSDPILQFDSLVPKSPLLEGQLSVLVGIKGPGNDGATFFCNCHLKLNISIALNFIIPENSLDVVIQILILENIATQLLFCRIYKSGGVCLT